MKSLRFVLLTVLAACSGTQDGKSTTPNGGTGSGDGDKPMAAGDVAFDVPAAEIKGVIFEPEALGRPGMPLVGSKRPTTLEKQRTTFQNTKDPVQKEAHAAILATMLYEKSKTDKTNEKALVTEARQVLRDAATASGAKVDEITLRLLGSYELLLEDYAAAEKAWAGLVTAAPKDKDVLYNKAWWVFSLLKQFKNAEALAAVKNDTPSEKAPELAYAMAWAKWRGNDDPGAWQAIVAAAKGWGGNANRDALDRDVLLFAGRSAVPFETVSPQLFTIFGAKQPGQQYEVLAKLGLQSYGFAGRWKDGVTAIDKAITTAGTTVPANDLPILRYSQADFVVRLDDPETAAKYAKQALSAAEACTKCKPEEKLNVVQSVSIMARLFHILYATANDIRYYEPANQLYIAAIPMFSDANRRTEVNKDATALQQTLKNMKAGKGTHDPGAIGALLGRHNQEVQACYEDALAANPKIGGTLTVTLESDQSGQIKGVATEPKAGMGDMAAVAGCVAEAAKKWHLPKRGMAGTTRIKLAYSMSPRKP